MADLPDVKTRAAAVSTEEVLSALRNTAKSSAGGPSRLTGDLLREICSRRDTPGFTPALATVLTLLARGQAPREVAPFFAGANLVALKKPVAGGKDPDVRPIAVGDVMRRLVGKILAQRVRKEAASLLRRGKQVGVAVQRGNEAAASVMSSYAQRFSGQDRVILKVDFENAFNSVDRVAFLREVDAYFPQLSQWVRWCYLSPTDLFFGDHKVASVQGVQQGDPLGPLLFALAIRSMTEELLETPGLDGALWYLDDGTLRGSPEGVAAAYHTLVRRSAQLGLSVNEGKSELITLGNQSVDSLRSLGLPVADGASDVGIRLLRDNFMLLGVPIGDAEWCESFMATRVLKSQHNLRELALLGDSQAALYVLRFCEGFCRMVFFMRSIRANTGRYLDAFDSAVDACLSAILRDDHGSLPEHARLQASLPIRMGGLGVRRTRDHWSAASLASQSSISKLALELDHGFVSDPVFWQAAAEDFNSRVAEDARVDPLMMPSSPLDQRVLSAAVVDAQWKNLHASLPRRDKSRLLSTGMPMAGAFLTATPSGTNVLSNDTFAAVVRFRLGVAIHAMGSVCPACSVEDKPVAMDCFGDHTFSCSHGPHRIARHDALKHALHHAASQAGLEPHMEFGDAVPGGKRPADVYLPIGVGEGRPRCIDVTVLHPPAPSYSNWAAKFMGYAAKMGESKKRDKHQKGCEDAGLSFTPAAFETFGGAGDAAERLVNQLATCASARWERGEKGLAARTLREHLSVSYQRQVGASLLAHGALCLGVSAILPAADTESPDDSPIDPGYFAEALGELTDMEPEVDSASRINPVTEEEPVPAAEDHTTASRGLPTSRVPVVDSVRVERREAFDANLWASLSDAGPCGLSSVEQAAQLGAWTLPDWSYVVGDCAFDATLVSLPADVRGSITASSLRHRIVAKMRMHSFWHDSVEGGADVWARFMERNVPDPEGRSWADEVALQLMALVLHVNIAVLLDDCRPRVYSPIGDPKAVVLLLRTGGHRGHYSPLLFPAHLAKQIREVRSSHEGHVVCPHKGYMERCQGKEPDDADPLFSCSWCLSCVDQSLPHWSCPQCLIRVCAPCADDSTHLCHQSQRGLEELQGKAFQKPAQKRRRTRAPAPSAPPDVKKEPREDDATASAPDPPCRPPPDLQHVHSRLPSEPGGMAGNRKRKVSAREQEEAAEAARRDAEYSQPRPTPPLFPPPSATPSPAPSAHVASSALPVPSPPPSFHATPPTSSGSSSLSAQTSHDTASLPAPSGLFYASALAPSCSSSTSTPLASPAPSGSFSASAQAQQFSTTPYSASSHLNTTPASQSSRGATPQAAHMVDDDSSSSSTSDVDTDSDTDMDADSVSGEVQMSDAPLPVDGLGICGPHADHLLAIRASKTWNTSAVRCTRGVYPCLSMGGDIPTGLRTWVRLFHPLQNRADSDARPLDPQWAGDAFAEWWQARRLQSPGAPVCVYGSALWRRARSTRDSLNESQRRRRESQQTQ